MSKCRMWTKKPLARNKNLIQTKKLGLEWAVNGLGKPLRKKSDPKNRKNSKKSEWNCRMWTKNHYRETEFLFKHRFLTTLKLERKKIHAAKPLAFSLHFLFRRDQNHYSNLTSKIMKKCEQILIKRQCPNTIQILWIVKKQEKANNSPSHRSAAIKTDSTTRVQTL